MREMRRRKNTLVYKMGIFFGLTIAGELLLLVAIWMGGQVRSYRDFTLPIILIHLGYGILVGTYGLCRIYIPYQKAIKKIDEMCEEEHLQEANDICPETFPEIYEFIEACKSFLDDRNMIIQNKMAEYLALQNQINPHFLYNALESIRGDMLEDGNMEIAETLEALSIYFRYSVSGTGKMVTLEDELENIEYYCIVQKYRFGSNIQMEIKYAEEVPGILKIPMPKLILQPVVENAIFHGLEKKIGGGKITVQIETTEVRLLIDVIDDGRGIPENTLHRINESLKNALKEDKDTISESGHKGVALLNIAKRLQILYGLQYGVRIFSKENMGTCVRLTMPLNIRNKYQKDVDQTI